MLLVLVVKQQRKERKKEKKEKKTVAINNRPMKLWTLARHATSRHSTRVWREGERTYGNITGKRDGPGCNGRPLCAQVCVESTHCGCNLVVYNVAGKVWTEAIL